MNRIYWWDNKRPSGSVWTDDSDAALAIAKAMKSAGWKIVWMTYSLNSTRPMSGYENSLQEWIDSVAF